MKHWRLIYLTIPLTVAVFAAILLANEWKAARPAEGVGSLTGKCQPVPEAVRYAAEAETAEEETAEYRLDSYTEGDGPAPEWWNPGEPMAAEWTDCLLTANSQPSLSEVRDIGCPDWNLDSTIWGWDGHGAEAWELDLYARIVYLEFWGTSPECCEAGADSILMLWDSGYFGDTLGGVLSARAENGALVYTTYGFVCEAEYDPDGLAEIRELCEERFINGPEWGAEFFQLYGFPDWAVPCYEIDGVYFSTGKGW